MIRLLVRFEVEVYQDGVTTDEDYKSPNIVIDAPTHEKALAKLANSVARYNGAKLIGQ